MNTNPKIVDVIAKKSPYTDRLSYYIVVDHPVKYVYTRATLKEDIPDASRGKTFFLGRHGDFYDFLAGTARKGNAFAGSVFDIPLDDGTSFHCQGDVWSCCPRKTDPRTIQVGVATLEQLKDCYVFYAGNIAREVLEAWLSANAPSDNYYKYGSRPFLNHTPPRQKRQRTRSAAYKARRAARRASTQPEESLRGYNPETGCGAPYES